MVSAPENKYQYPTIVVLFFGEWFGFKWMMVYTLIAMEK